MDKLHYPKFAAKVKAAGVNRFNFREVIDFMENFFNETSFAKLLILAHAAPDEEEFRSIVISFGNGFAPFPTEGDFSNLNSVFDEIEAACA